MSGPGRDGEIRTHETSRPQNGRSDLTELHPGVIVSPIRHA